MKLNMIITHKYIMMENKKLKFSIERDEEGQIKVEYSGNAMEIGKNLFYPFFTQEGMEGKAIAAGISAAMKLAYPHAFKKNKKQINS